MIFNLSERKYDYTKFHDNVLEFGWPDHHSPPLGEWLSRCTASETVQFLNSFRHYGDRASLPSVSIYACVAQG